MDLLSRLIAGSGATTRKNKGVHTSAERLGACRRLYNALQSIWRNETPLSRDDAQSRHVVNILRRLITFLEDESHGVAPHSCLQYLASQQAYNIIIKLAIGSENPQLILQTSHFLRQLINGEVDGILDSVIFARCLVDFVQTCTAPANIVVDQQGESTLVELLFEIATKIRLDPEIITAWFYPERRTGASASISEARKNQFPLFYVLVNYVHSDGTTGDYSRTALLYLTETASRSRPLEKWMMESDLAPQMASGLSALYSRLSRQSRKLSREDLHILTFSDGADEPAESILLEDTSKDQKAFLIYLAFWQDTLTRCSSTEVRETLLDHFQALFVEQLLYPSLLESSDAQAGSTAAVLLHLCRILSVLSYPQMTQRTLDYLFAHQEHETIKIAPKHSRMSLSRRTSFDSLTALTKLADNPSPDLFSLLDLIVFSLRSGITETLTASLRLVTLLLQQHHPLVRNQLFILTIPDPASRQNLNALNHSMLSMFDAATEISPINTMDQSYQEALQDAQLMLERHSCLATSMNSQTSAIRPATMAVSPNCRVFQQLCTLLQNWFSNDTRVNLELTGTFAALSSCEHVHLSSWLLPQPFAEGLLHTSHLGVIGIIQSLAAQAKAWRQQFVEWDVFYSIQRVELVSDGDTPLDAPLRSRIFTEKMALNEETRKASGGLIQQPRQASTSTRISSIGAVLATSPSRTAVPSSARSSEGATDLESTRSASSGNLSDTLLETRIPVKTLPVDLRTSKNFDSSEEVPEDFGTQGDRNGENCGSREEHTASLKHILTQAIILQEFILELAATLQIRATLFDEVDLS